VSDKTIVVTSATIESDYSFPLPLTMLLWRELVGFEPRVYLVDSRSGAWERGGPKACVDALIHHGFQYQYLYGVPNYPDLTAAKHVREHAACDRTIEDDTWIVPADADLWPLKREFYLQHENASECAVLYYSNGDGFKSQAETIEKFEKGVRFPTISLCHTVMRASNWRSTWELDGELVSSLERTFYKHGVNDASRVPSDETFDAWRWWVNSDQRVLTYRLCKQPWFHDQGKGTQVRFVERNRRRGPPNDRLDRAFRAGWNAPQGNWVDAHIHKRPDGAWEWMTLYALFSSKLPHHSAWAQRYYREYVGVPE
jgi:hypothetical protein